MTYRDAVYNRISEDDLLQERGVTRQSEDGHTLSRARGGEVVLERTDNDISALKGAPRDGYDDLMRAVDAGDVDRVIVFQTSRLWRNRAERAVGMERFRKAGVPILAVKGPDLDLTTASGRLVAGILGEVDTAESEIKGERIVRAGRQRAEEGRANGAVLYGWRREYIHDSRGRVTGWEDVEDNDTAVVVREIVARLVGKQSVTAITADLNRRGIAPPHAHHDRKHETARAGQPPEWSKATVRALAMRPANVGLRVYHRGLPDERLIPAAWPAIVDKVDHERVTEILRGRSRTGRPVRPGAREHLLTWGIGECGVDTCRDVLVVAPRGTKPLPTYCCRRGCVGRNKARVDEYVGDVMIARVRQSDIADLMTPDQGGHLKLLEEVEILKARLLKVAQDCAADRITDEQMHTMTGSLRAKLRDAEAAAARVRTSPHMGLVAAMIAAGEAAGGVWRRYDVNQKRAVIDILVERIRIMPARRGAGFDPRTVKIDFRGSAG